MENPLALGCWVRTQGSPVRPLGKLSRENRGNVQERPPSWWKWDSFAAFLWLPVNHILPIHHWRILPPSAAVRPSSEAAAGAGSWDRGDPRGGSDESAAPQWLRVNEVCKVVKNKELIGTSCFESDLELKVESLHRQPCDPCGIRSSSWMDATQIPQALPPWPLGPWTSKGVDRKAEMTPATLVVPIQVATYSQTCEYPAEVCSRSTRSSEQWNSLS
jgi:hypothetical protein